MLLHKQKTRHLAYKSGPLGFNCESSYKSYVTLTKSFHLFLFQFIHWQSVIGPFNLKIEFISMRLNLKHMILNL